jgi:hypothetical protein
VKRKEGGRQRAGVGLLIGACLARGGGGKTEHSRRSGPGSNELCSYNTTAGKLVTSGSLAQFKFSTN